MNKSVTFLIIGIAAAIGLVACDNSSQSNSAATTEDMAEVSATSAGTTHGLHPFPASRGSSM